MSFFGNKHLLVATLMAPVLAIVSYYAVNYFVGEDAKVAEAGQSYKLVEKPNCRYASGQCGLKNGDFELSLSFDRLDDGRLLLKLTSEHPLDGAMLAMIENEADDKEPVEMRPMGDGLNWSLELPRPDPELHRLRLVASANQALYFGDVAMKFTLGEAGN